MTEKACKHKYIYGGIKYQIDPYPMSGTGAKRRDYYDWYYCEHCLTKQYSLSLYHDTTYEKIAFNATPRE